MQTIRRLHARPSIEAGTELVSVLERDDVHMLILALQHLYECVSVLVRSGEPLLGGKDYQATWDRIRDLRDAFEHEEDYIAGRGKYPERMVSASWIESDLPDIAQVVDDDGLKEVHFFGRPYEIGPAIMAALNLDEVLLQLKRTLSED